MQDKATMSSINTTMHREFQCFFLFDRIFLLRLKPFSFAFCVFFFVGPSVTFPFISSPINSMPSFCEREIHWILIGTGYCDFVVCQVRCAVIKSHFTFEAIFVLRKRRILCTFNEWNRIGISIAHATHQTMNEVFFFDTETFSIIWTCRCCCCFFLSLKLVYCCYLMPLPLTLCSHIFYEFTWNWLLEIAVSLRTERKNEGKKEKTSHKKTWNFFLLSFCKFFAAYLRTWDRTKERRRKCITWFWNSCFGQT